MNDRDDYPDNPYRGRTNRERDYDYDPLSDPLPSRPRPRGRRARPQPEAWNERPGTGGYESLSPDGPPPGRRRRPEAPADGPARPPRRTGAADALRGGRAARSGGSRPQGAPRAQGPAEPGHPGADADPTHDALAALANMGGAPQPSPEMEEPPRRGRRSRPEPEPEAPSPRDEEPRGRRGGRRRRGAPVEESSPAAEAPPAEEPEPRGRARRRRGRREAEPTGGFLDDMPEDSGVFDSGVFPGVSGSADTGAFAAVDEPPRRRGRRTRRARRDGSERGAWEDRAEEASDGGGHDEEPFSAEAGGLSGDQEPASDAFSEPEAEPGPRGRRRRAAARDEEPRGRRGGRRRRGRREEPAEPPREYDPPAEEDDEAFTEPEAEPEAEPGPRGRRRRAAARDEEPRGRRGSRRRRGRREEPEPEPDEDEEEYEEPNLADIAEAYGGGRRSRRKAKELKRARANAGINGKKRRRRSKGLMILLALVLLLVIAGGGYAVMRTYVFPADFEGQGSGEAVFVIEEGESGSTIADNLADMGVVASPHAFLNALEAVPEEELGHGMAPGSYSLAQGMSGEAAVAALLDPDNRIGGRITIREGLRPGEIFEQIAEETDLSVEELEEAYAQTDQLGLPDYASEGPAGYLFPTTYRFDPGTDALSVLQTMMTQHGRVAEELGLEDRAADRDYDPNEIMTIASIVQAESGNTEDMPKIARVVHNRLEEDMPLQMDSTCFYALGEHGIALNQEQLDACEQDTTGFDTYHRTGLPPGPFVAPGEDAIEAALDPAEGDWLYFVATDPENGVTEFTGSYDEFLQLKEEFQQNWTGE